MWRWIGSLGIWYGKVDASDRYWGPRLGSADTPMLLLGFGGFDVGFSTKARRVVNALQAACAQLQRIPQLAS